MAEYIEREELINTLDSLCDRVCEYSPMQRNFMCGSCPLGIAFDTVEEFHAADVAPVVHGEWIEYPECLQYENAFSDDHIVCSNCKAVFNVLDNCTECFVCCPNCGARMDGGT